MTPSPASCLRFAPRDRDDWRPRPGATIWQRICSACLQMPHGRHFGFACRQRPEHRFKDDLGGVVHGQQTGYSGWNSATVLPSGSLNHADLPIRAVVATWPTV